MDCSIAWFTGIFEGEGCIVFRGSHGVELTIKMSDLDIIERVHKVAGAGYVHAETRKPGLKPMWAWTAGRKEDVERLLIMMLPYFGERRSARATAALKRLEDNSGRPVAVCGSPGGRKRHRMRKEPMCRACKDAAAAYARVWRSRQKEVMTG